MIQQFCMVSWESAYLLGHESWSYGLYIGNLVLDTEYKKLTN